MLDYLSEEVLAQQPTLVQSFLLHTSVLSRLNGSLCDAVTGQEGSQGVLEALERANLFVVALDEERQWYRYHHLFAEVLNHRLAQTKPQLVPDLHRRASTWYEQNALPAEAVQHALAIPDAEHAARLIEQIASPLIFLQGQIDTVRGWLNALPEAMVRTRPPLCILQAVCLLFTNQLDAAESRLQWAERGIQEEVPAEQVQTILGWVISVRTGIAVLSGDVERALSLARQVLALLPETEVIPRASVMVTTALVYAVSGDVTPVIEREVAAAVALNRTLNNLFLAVNSICVLAWLYVLQGRLRQARVTYAEVMQLALRPEVLHTMYNNHYYYFGLGHLLYEWNELEAAERHLAQGVALINEALTVDPFWATPGYTTLAHLQQVHGNTPAAFATLDALAHLAEQRHFSSNWIAQREAVRAQLELAQGNLAAAIQWANRSGLSSEDEDLPYPREGEYLTLAKSTHRSGTGRSGRTISPGRAKRTGSSPCRGRSESTHGQQPASNAPGSSALAEPLTEREREVLRLLLEGASNREIARRLVLSINTVKRHIYNLCGKMGVQSRSQAIVKARALDLS